MLNCTCIYVILPRNVEAHLKSEYHTITQMSMWYPLDALWSISWWSHDSCGAVTGIQQDSTVLAMKLSGVFHLIFLCWPKACFQNTLKELPPCQYLSFLSMGVKPVPLKICILIFAVEEFWGSHYFCHEEVSSRISISPTTQQNGNCWFHHFPVVLHSTLDSLRLSSQPMCNCHLHCHKAGFQTTDKTWVELMIIVWPYKPLNSSKFFNMDAQSIGGQLRGRLGHFLSHTDKCFFSVYVNCIKGYALITPKRALHHPHMPHDLPEIHIGQSLDGHVIPMECSYDSVVTPLGPWSWEEHYLILDRLGKRSAHTTNILDTVTEINVQCMAHRPKLSTLTEEKGDLHHGDSTVLPSNDGVWRPGQCHKASLLLTIIQWNLDLKSPSISLLEISRFETLNLKAWLFSGKNIFLGKLECWLQVGNFSYEEEWQLCLAVPMPSPFPWYRAETSSHSISSVFC